MELASVRRKLQGCYANTNTGSDCITSVELSLRSPVTGQLELGEEKHCDMDPAVFQCYREEADAIYTDFQSYDNPSFMERLRYLLQIYGPFSKSDKQFFKYWFRSQELQHSTGNTKMPSPPMGTKPLAFVLLLDKNFHRFAQLWKHIYKPWHFYAIHIDYDSSSLYYHEVQQLVYDMSRHYGNVEILRERIEGYWGSMSLVYMEIAALIRLRQKDPHKTWSHVINLSAHDFPTKPLFKLESFLGSDENANVSFIVEEIGNRPERQKLLWMECDRPRGRQAKMITVGTRRGLLGEFNSDNYMYAKSPNIKYSTMDGSQWHVLSREFVEVYTNSTDLDILELILSYRYTFVPDEAIIQTVYKTYEHIFSAPKSKVNLRFTNLDRKGSELTTEDLPAILNSPKFFARKVTTDEVADALESELIRQNY